MSRACREAWNLPRDSEQKLLTVCNKLSKGIYFTKRERGWTKHFGWTVPQGFKAPLRVQTALEGLSWLPKNVQNCKSRQILPTSEIHTRTVVCDHTRGWTPKETKQGRYDRGGCTEEIPNTVRDDAAAVPSSLGSACVPWGIHTWFQLT